MELDEVIAGIIKLEDEREAIYLDDRVDIDERPRLREIEAELDRLWDLRRRLEAARTVGLAHVPVPPPPDPSKLTGGSTQRPLGPLPSRAAAVRSASGLTCRANGAATGSTVSELQPSCLLSAAAAGERGGPGPPRTKSAANSSGGREVAGGYLEGSPSRT